LENDLLHCRDPLKKILDSCRVQAGWKNKRVAIDNKITIKNDGAAFETSGE